MAATPSRITYSEDGQIQLPPDPNDPGYAVDALLAAGDIEGARAELERLALEGMDSGEAIEMTPEAWEEFRLQLHREAKIAS